MEFNCYHMLCVCGGGGSPALCHWTIVASQSCPHRTCHLCLCVRVCVCVCVCVCGHTRATRLACCSSWDFSFFFLKDVYSSRKAMAPLLCEGSLKYELLFPWKLLSRCYGSTAWIPLAFVRGKK